MKNSYFVEFKTVLDPQKNANIFLTAIHSRDGHPNRRAISHLRAANTRIKKKHITSRRVGEIRRRDMERVRAHSMVRRAVIILPSGSLNNVRLCAVIVYVCKSDNVRARVSLCVCVCVRSRTIKSNSDDDPDDRTSTTLISARASVPGKLSLRVFRRRNVFSPHKSNYLFSGSLF